MALLFARRCAIACMAIVAGACGGGEKERDEVQAALRKTLSARARPAYVTADAEGRKLWKLTQQFYERRQHAPAWIEGNDPRPEMGELIAAIQGARQEGLDPELYNVTLLEQRRQEARKGFLTKKGFNPADAGALDAWLTHLYMKYASDLADGLSDLAHADPHWKIKPEEFDPTSQLETALQSNTIGQSLSQLLPGSPQYHALRKSLDEFRAQAARGGWPALPAALRLKPGQRSARVGALARRLSASGDYSGPIPVGAAAYDAGLQAAVKRFQRRHGLSDDAVVGREVVAELNVPIEKRMAQVALNMERWRWLPRKLGDRHVLVNIPEYLLEIVEGDRVVLAMRVVVGRPDTPTPIFNDTMTYLVFSPYWNVPPEIAEGETLPEILKDPGFLARANMEVLDTEGTVIDPASIDLADPTQYRFRQRPGADNSLGLVKFMFPNQYNVYLHDTPAGSLFARVSRSFSHGCVRVEQPLALAQYVLRDQPEWTQDRMQEAMNAQEERTVKLRAPIPVYLGYWTARVAQDGVLQFRKDVYGIDGRQQALLSERLKRLRKSAAAAAMAMNEVSGRSSEGSTD